MPRGIDARQRGMLAAMQRGSESGQAHWVSLPRPSWFFRYHSRCMTCGLEWRKWSAKGCHDLALAHTLNVTKGEDDERPEHAPQHGHDAGRGDEGG